MIRALLALALAATLATAAVAGPWTLAPGRSRLGMTALAAGFDEIHAFDGTRRPVPAVRFRALELSAAHGLTDRLEVSASATRAANEQSANPAADYDGWGDARAALKYRLWREEAGEPVSLSAMLELKTPLRSYPTSDFSAPGDGQDDLEFRVSAGKLLDAGTFFSYWTVEAAFRSRRGEPGDERLLYGELGLPLRGRAAGRVFAQRVEQTSGLGLLSPAFLTRAAVEGRAPFPAVDEDFTLLGAGVGYRLTSEWDASLFLATQVSTRNTGFQDLMGISISHEF